MTGQKTWAIGEETLAVDFNNYVQSQVVAQFANAAARDAWGSPPNGALCVTLDTNFVWQRIGGAWAFLNRRIGFSGVNAGQAYTSGQTALLTWPTEVWDTDNFASGGSTITAPANLGGIYSVSCFIIATGAPAGPCAVDILVAGSAVARSILPVGQTSVSVAVTADVAATQAVTVQIINGHSASLTFSAQVRMVRIST